MYAKKYWKCVCYWTKIVLLYFQSEYDPREVIMLCKRVHRGDTNDALSEFWEGSVTVSHLFTYKMIPLD